MVNSSPYSTDYDTPMNKQFIADIVKLSNNLPGFYAVDLYVHGQVVEAAMIATGGKTGDREAFMKALLAVKLTDTPRGPVRFDHLGQGVGDIHIRRIEKVNGALTNKTLKTYHDVTQFWTFDEKWYLSQPPYSRDYPPMKS
jgi:branched-chain amino acid transport system substrate-binding protein